MASVLSPDASAAALRSGTPSASTSATPSPNDAFEAIHDPTFSLDCWRSRMTPWSASAAPVAPGAGAEGAAADVGAGAAGSEGAASGTEGSIAASDDDAPDAPPRGGQPRGEGCRLCTQRGGQRGGGPGTGAGNADSRERHGAQRR